MNNDTLPIPAEIIEQKILFFRGLKVILDTDLAQLYGVETKALTRAVRRNQDRFPNDFMFQLHLEEFGTLRRHFGTSNLKSQFGSSKGRGGRRYLPYVFTEQGVAMLSSVLRSKRAVRVNIEIMRAFVRLRQMISTNKDLARRLDDLEKKYDHQFKVVFDAIRQLMAPPPLPPKRQIGF